MWGNCPATGGWWPLHESTAIVIGTADRRSWWGPDRFWLSPHRLCLTTQDLVVTTQVLVVNTLQSAMHRQQVPRSSILLKKTGSLVEHGVLRPASAGLLNPSAHYTGKQENLSAHCLNPGQVYTVSPSWTQPVDLSGLPITDNKKTFGMIQWTLGDMVTFGIIWWSFEW